MNSGVSLSLSLSLSYLLRDNYTTPSKHFFFRSSNLAAESFAISCRYLGKCAITARTQACLIWPIQSGYTCFLRAMYHQPSSHEGICKICQEAIDKILDDPTNIIFRENLVFPTNRRIAEMEDGDDFEPEEIMKQKDLVRAAMNNAEAYKGKRCHKQYLDKVAEAHHLLAYYQRKHEIAKNEAKRNRDFQLKADYLRSCYGDADLLREILFMLSAICITPERLKFLALIVNAATGCISVSITFEDPADGILKRIDFADVFVNCFKNMEETDEFHAYFSGRGRHSAFQTLYIGAVTVLPLLSNTTTSRAERKLRENEKTNYGMRLSLASAARLELLKTKRESVFQDAVKFTHGMNAIEFGETNFYASLSYAASYLQLSTIQGVYAQPNDNKKRTKVFVPTQKPTPTQAQTPAQAQAQAPSRFEPRPNEDENATMHAHPQSPFSEAWEDHRMAELDAAVENNAQIKKQKLTLYDQDLEDLDCDFLPASSPFQEQEEAELDATTEHKNTRKQKLVLRNHEENEGFFKFVYEEEPPFPMPQINVRNGNFEDFLREWNRTDDLPLRHQIYHRRQLNQYFQPILQSTTTLDESLFNFAAYNLLEF